MKKSFLFWCLLLSCALSNLESKAETVTAAATGRQIVVEESNQYSKITFAGVPPRTRAQTWLIAKSMMSFADASALCQGLGGMLPKTRDHVERIYMSYFIKPNDSNFERNTKDTLGREIIALQETPSCYHGRCFWSSTMAHGSRMVGTRSGFPAIKLSPAGVTEADQLNVICVKD